MTVNILFDEGFSMRLVVFHEFERRLRQELDVEFAEDKDHGESIALAGGVVHFCRNQRTACELIGTDSVSSLFCAEIAPIPFEEASD